MSGSFLLLIFFVPTVLGVKQSRNGRPENDIDSVHADTVTIITTTEDPVIEKTPPKFSQPNKMYFREIKPLGSSTRFKCKAEGNPTPNITWYKDDEPITRPYFPASYGKWSVRLDEVIKTDSGNYTCVVCNELGCINHTVSFHVQERYPSKPVFKEPLRNITATWNDTVSFSCNVISDLEPYILWSWRSPNTTEEKIIESIDDKPETLTIHNVSVDSAGWYKCTAMTTLGQVSSKAYLQVVEHDFEEEIQLISSSDRFATIISKCLIAMVMISISITIIVIKKFYQEIIKKRRDDTEHLMEKQWTKPIRVEHILKDAVMIPDVTMERLRYTEMSNVAKRIYSAYIYFSAHMKWELLRAVLKLVEVLWQGEFGKVLKAKYTDTMCKTRTVAVKMLKGLLGFYSSKSSSFLNACHEFGTNT